MFEQSQVMLKLLVFIVVSAGFVYVSRASLRAPRSHGFYRFFAWEAVLVLFLLNVDMWFYEPFSVTQIVSWFLLAISLVLVVCGVRQLHIAGKHGDTSTDDAPRVWIEKTTVLVTSGVYRYIRHPLYSSLLFLDWGVFFKAPSWLGGGLALAAAILLVVTAKMEEAENIRFFGAAYQSYMKQTRMFVPFIF